tara:strand:+ start:6692 stop:7513 length:822 start_codon:yes stop_codon:yes gene_type:complete
MTQLVKYDAACRAVAEAVSIDEAKEFRDQSEAMRAYAKQAKNKQLEVQAAEIRIRAERRIGELMAAQRDAGGLAKGGQPHQSTGLQHNPVAPAPTLAEVGIDKNLADRARKYAAIPEDEFNGIVSDWKGRVEQENQRVTVNLLAAGDRAAEKAQPVDEAESDLEAAKLRREIGKLTPDAMIDEIIGLRADLAERKEQIKAQKAEILSLKDEVGLLRQDNLGRALGNEKRRADAAEGRMREHQATAARLQRQVNAQKSEIERLKREDEKRMIPL